MSYFTAVSSMYSNKLKVLFDVLHLWLVFFILGQMQTPQIKVVSNRKTQVLRPLHELPASLSDSVASLLSPYSHKASVQFEKKVYKLVSQIIPTAGLKERKLV